MQTITAVGMDVDSERTAVSVPEGFEGQPRLERIVGNKTKEIEQFFKELLGDKNLVHPFFEAFGCGYTLYRLLMDWTMSLDGGYLGGPRPMPYLPHPCSSSPGATAPTSASCVRCLSPSW